ncbi:8103_t:CDS:2 [Cetraspora pellucida]|uniref:8103_t:CDS:1 n=1 Tax=Cetraspora pellucida TaxID=1433469 RepID=A0ACA9LG61_9GLOM|nr:8103_t:CDS:2 [Cetraspora pellucida]
MLRKQWLDDAMKNDHIRSIKFEDFYDLSAVARGAFGVVWKAYWKNGEKHVALKTLLDNPAAGAEETFENFVRELKFIRHLDFCDHVIRFYGISYDPTTSRYYMVMQYADGGNLRDFLRRNFEKLDWITKISMGKHIASGLNAIHSEDILHRDLHSKNIMVHDGKLMITDFGLSKSSLAAQDSAVAGMAAYVEPKYPSQQSCLDALKVIVSKKPVNVVNNCLNTPNNSTPIAPSLSQVNANMAGMSINDQNRLGMNNNINAHRPPERPGPGGATNLNHLNNFDQRNNQLNPQMRFVGQHPTPVVNQNPNFVDRMPTNHPQNPNFPSQIPSNAQSFVKLNPIPPINPAQRIPGQNPILVNGMVQNFNNQSTTPVNNFADKKHLPNAFGQYQMSNFTRPPQQPIVNNLGQHFVQRPIIDNRPLTFSQTNPNPITHNIPPTHSAPVLHMGNQQFSNTRSPLQNGGQQINQGNITPFLGPNIGPFQNNANVNIGQGPGGNPTVNAQRINTQIQPNTLTQPIQNISPRISPRISPNILPQNGVNPRIVTNVIPNGVSNINLNLGGQNAPGFQEHRVNNKISPNSVVLNASGFPTPPNSGGPNAQGFQRHHVNNQSPTTAPNSGVQTPQSLSLNFGAPSPDGNTTSITSIIECPQIKQCHDVKERYRKDYGTVLGYEDSKECHAGFHAGFGDVEGLRHHFRHGAKVNGISRFLTTREHLVIVAAKYCSRRKLIEIFKVLKEHKANFRCTSNSSGKTALHHLYENQSLTRDITDSKGLQKFHKYMKEAIEFLVANGCNINAMDNSRQTILSYYLCDKFRHREFAPIVIMLLKNGADPNIPLKTTVLQPYNAPNALYLAVKIGWPIEVLDVLLSKGARGDVKDENGDNLLVLAAREKQSTTIDWILETIPEASTRDCIEAAMKLSDKKYRSKLSKWKGSEGASRRRLVQENLELKRQLRTETESTKETNYESASD